MTEKTPLLQSPNLEAATEIKPSTRRCAAQRLVWTRAALLLSFLGVLAAVGTFKGHKKADVCLTPACVHASSEILYNLSPKYQELDACTDFEQLVCEGWSERHDLRPDQGSTGTLSTMSETSQTLLRHILEAKYPEESKHSSFSPAQLAITESSIDRENFEKLKTAYDACMDEDTIKKVGATPLLDVFEQTLNITELSDVITYLAQQGISAFVSSGAGADDTNPDVVVVQVSSPWSIGLPSKDYYKNDDIVAKYQSAIGQVFEALNNEAQKQGRSLNFSTATSEGVLNLEKKLAAASPDAEDRDDVTKYYNPMTPEEADKLTPSIQLSKIVDTLAPANFRTDRLIIMAPDYMKALEETLKSTSEDDLQAYFLWKTIQSYASAIESDTLKPYKRFVNALQGKEPDATQERWRTCVGHVDNGLGWILSRFFVEKAFSAKARDFGNQIIYDIKDSFIETLKVTKWMDKSVIKLAIDKVHQIVQKIGYPTKSPDIMDPKTLLEYYKGVDINSTTFFSNAVSIRRFGTAREWSSLGKPVDRDEWGMTVPTVNAYYNPPGNEIVFPAGIMQFPVFDVNLPKYISYGAFGSVSGHELSHAFDSTGRHYDQNGNYTDWWTPDTVKGFQARADCFVDQYHNFTVEGPDGKPLHVNGKLTLGENIADAGGVAAAYSAWTRRRAEKKDQNLPGLEHFSQEQLFFVSYATAWCGKSRSAEAVRRVYTDPHSPPWARVLGTTANSKDFLKAFKCPAKKPVCQLW